MIIEKKEKNPFCFFKINQSMNHLIKCILNGSPAVKNKDLDMVINMKLIKIMFLGFFCEQ